MKKIKFATDRSQVQRGVQLTDGRIVPVVNLDGKFVVTYEVPFNLETGEIYDEPNKLSTTLNEQCKNGAKNVFCYDSYDINLGNRFDLDEKIEDVMREFSEHRFNVTKAAIMHNYVAWLADMKSGYRDVENGYHLFSPCGCNPFSLTATTLHPSCEDWQHTYEW